MKTLYLIPARGGSKGIPHKNIKLLNGKPLIQYSIEIARKLASDKDICVSTDDEEIKSVAERCGLKVPFLRPDYLAGDTATTSDVIVHALDYYAQQGINYDAVVLLQPTSPLRTVQNVKDCLALYTPDLDMVTTVRESSVSAVLCRENELGFLEQVIGKSNVRRQDAEKLYEYNGAVYVINAIAVKEKGLGEFTKIKKCVMPEIISVDIDTMMDWYLIEVIMQNTIQTSRERERVRES
ncbi:MAG: acylneuraminate cytidylyltransferase family protein [Treponema sp.]|nr:acylneuraminate cytidylyltransferase family protein [Treponema sp.]